MAILRMDFHTLSGQPSLSIMRLIFVNNLLWADQNTLIIEEPPQQDKRLFFCFDACLLGCSIGDIWLHEYFSMRERRDFRNDIYAMKDQHAHSVSALFP